MGSLKNNGKYMVNLIGEDRWEGAMYDTREEAIEAGKEALLNKNIEVDDTFGDWLGNMLLYKDGEYLFPDKFALGVVKTLDVPEKLGYDIIDNLDENVWVDDIYGNDYPSKYIFSEEDKEEFDRLITDYLTNKIDESSYYIVNVIEEVKVTQVNEKEDKILNNIKQDFIRELIDVKKVREVKKKTDKGYVYEQYMGQYLGAEGVSIEESLESIEESLEDTKEYYLEEGIYVYIDKVNYLMKENVVIVFK